MRVIFITSNLNVGGKEKQLIEALKSLTNSTISISLIVLNINQKYSNIAKKYSDNVYEIDRGILKIKPFRKIWKIINKLKPDIIHSWDTLASFYAYPICKYLNIYFIEGSIRDSGIDHGWEYIYKRFFLKRANLVISNSYAGLNAHNIKGEVIYNSLDLDEFKNLQSFKSEFNLIMVGNFYGYKDHKTFIDASFELLEKDVINCAYLIGDGPQKNFYINYVKKLKPKFTERFVFTGELVDIRKYLSQCKIGVLCSTEKYSEGISNAILEYMASGLVCVATNLGGTSEIIEHDKNGYLIEPGDKLTLIYYINKLKQHNDIIEKFKINAINTVKAKFSKDNYAKKLKSLYHNLINNNHSY